MGKNKISPSLVNRVAIKKLNNLQKIKINMKFNKEE